MRSTYPYMLVDFHTPTAVENVTLDFGIGEDLANSNLNVLITNHRDPEKAGNDICFHQYNSKVLRRQILSVKCAAQVVGRYMILQFRGSDRVELYICSVSIQGSSSSPYENLAEYQTTKQISRLFQTQTPLPKANYFAFLAVDGNTSLAYDPDKFNDSSCQASGVEGAPWMAVDLAQESAVSGASLHINPSLYDDADVLTILVSNNNPTLAGDPICANITAFSSITTTPVPVKCENGTIYGRYVNVSLTTATPKSLVICELQVWGRNCTDRIDRAIKKPVLSSTTLGSSLSHHLVDYQPDTTFSTDYEANPYIIVDLIGTYYLDYIELDLADSEIEGLNLSTSNNISLVEFKQTGPEVRLIEAGALRVQHCPCILFTWQLLVCMCRCDELPDEDLRTV
ncbi:hypothetical protein RvY_16436-1 [Ramazzottius varieornatus]|uniref:Fucolectin tachylectin-4 pentraxin-1 domain-containing protein n=1 Tax=Ramazzottius varieornatus TaxID=947166 RepID=A0A1D1W4V1_RAMVA|nr:hypothetical protein RvY_16436-1 [Ramazzottius varieornatus]